MKIEISDSIIEKAIRSNYKVKEPFNIDNYTKEDILESLEWYISEEEGSLISDR